MAACVLLGTARAGSDDPIEKLAALMRRLRERPELLEGPALATARSQIVDIRLVWSIDPARAQDSALCMLDLMGMYLDASPDPGRPTPESELRDAAKSALEAHFDPTFGRWLATDVLPAGRGQPLERRLAVLRLLETNTVPASREPLLACAREGERRVALAARRALAGWSDESIHELFFPEISGSGPRRDLDLERLAEQHFVAARFAPDSAIARALAERVRRDLVSPDWRVASRATRLSRPLENEAVVAALIEGLSAWKSRGDAGARALRLRHELRRALRERSGRAFGLDPQEWREWWALVRAGKVRGLTAASAGGFQESTEASFFGIRPQSDRIVFVVDRSGSMAEPFRLTGGPAGSRFDEAIRQLSSFLEAMGPSTHFDVVLFHDLADSFRGELVPATPENLAALREWMTFQKPAGGTRLRAGVEAALRADRTGHVVLERVEADTVIILCDGETAEGPGWVEGFLEVMGPLTRTVFHGIQLGPDGDATMSRLAQGSRGDFVREGG